MAWRFIFRTNIDFKQQRKKDRPGEFPGPVLFVFDAPDKGCGLYAALSLPKGGDYFLVFGHILIRERIAEQIPCADVCRRENAFSR